MSKEFWLQLAKLFIIIIINNNFICIVLFKSRGYKVHQKKKSKKKKPHIKYRHMQCSTTYTH